MKKLLLLILSILVLFAMALSFASCGEEETPPSSSAQKVETPNGDGGSGDGGGGDGESGGGGEPAECTHTSLEGTLIKFSDLGEVCGGGLYVDVCKDCQKVLLANDEPLVTLCKYDGESDKCTKCGLEISVEGSKSGCVTTLTFDVSLNGNKLLDGFKAEGESHQWEYRVKELDEFSCGVSAVFEECLGCKESKFVSTVHNGEVNVTSSKVNDLGFEKIVTESSCAECGYKETRKTIELECYTSTGITLSKNGTLLYSGAIDNETSSHSYAITAVKCGDTCDKGVFVIKKCTVCQEKDYYTLKDHHYVEENYDLSGSTPCGGCNEIFGVEELPTGCTIKFLDQSYDYDTKTQETEYSCVDCGLSLKIIERNSGTFNCTNEVGSTVTMKIGEETLLLVDYDISRMYHYGEEYELSYELVGESCDEGRIETGICSECGDRRITLSFSRGHGGGANEEINLNLPCNTKYWVEECLCGEEKFVYSNGFCITDPIEAGVEEINGITFKTQTFACFDCGAVFVKKEGTKVDGCVSTYYEQEVVTYNGEVIFDTGVYKATSYADHEYEIRNIPLGPSCEKDGMIRYKTCKSCGESDYDYYGYHYTAEKEKIDLTQYGVCGSYILIEACTCKEGIIEAIYDQDLCNIESAYEKIENGERRTYSCTDCGFVITEEQITVVKDCVEYTTYKYTYSKGDTVIYEHTREAGGNTSHSLEYIYRLAGESCYEGLYETARCLNCDFERVQRYESCRIIEEMEIELSKYGICDGYYRYVNCPCGDAENEYFGLFCDATETDRNTETIDGIAYTTTTYTCQKCGVVLVETKYKANELCYEYEYTVSTIIMGEDVLFENMTRKSFIYARHEKETTVEMKGASCLDGIEVTETCTVCGYRTSIDYYDHQLFAKYQEEGEPGCYHRIIFWECPCGEERALDVNFIDETENGYECKDCQIVIEISYLSEKNGCKTEKTKINKFYVDGVLEFTGEEIFVYDSHSLGAPVVTEGEGKSIITSTCTECGTSVVQEVYVAVLEEGDWGNVCIFDFTPDADGTYTLYSSNAQIKSNFVYEEENMVLYAFYGEGKSRPSAVVELEKGKAYKYEALDYSYGATLGAIVMVQGEYGVCEGEIGEDAITVTIQNGAYTITLCPSCHMVLEIEAVTE